MMIEQDERIDALFQTCRMKIPVLRDLPDPADEEVVFPRRPIARRESRVVSVSGGVQAFCLTVAASLHALAVGVVATL